MSVSLINHHHLGGCRRVQRESMKMIGLRKFESEDQMKLRMQIEKWSQADYKLDEVPRIADRCFEIMARRQFVESFTSTCKKD